MVVEECLRAISYLKEYSYPKLKQETTTTKLALQEEQIYAECGLRLKNFYPSNLPQLYLCFALFVNCTS